MNNRTRFLTVLVMAVVGLMLTIGPAVAQDDTLVVWADDTRAPALAALADDFEAELGIALDVQELDFGDIRDNLKVAGPAGEGPDIIVGAHDWLGELVANGLLAPIDLGDQADDFLPAAVQAFVYDGELYGMPYGTENVAFVRNPELVPNAPETWDEVREISEALVAEGASQYGFIRQSADPYHFFPIQTAFGGYVFGVTDEGYDPSDVGIDSEGSLAAAAWFEGMVADGLQPPPDVDYDVMHALFESGDAAMIVTGPWALPRIEESGVPFEVSGLPAGPAGPAKPFLGVQGFMISAFSENQLLAEIFLLDWVATDEVMQAIYDADPRPSAFLSVREGIEGDIAGFAAAGSEGLAMPAIPEMGSVWTAWTDALTLITNEEISADEAFTTAAEQIRTLLEESS
jgi:maltose/maltodextrin transport system substrate-binding protein/arabinogalactan oligomer/maltooligosaccharide transport system substrate-binding protein